MGLALPARLWLRRSKGITRSAPAPVSGLSRRPGPFPQAQGSGGGVALRSRSLQRQVVLPEIVAIGAGAPLYIIGADSCR